MLFAMLSWRWWLRRPIVQHSALQTRFPRKSVNDMRKVAQIRVVQCSKASHLRSSSEKEDVYVTMTTESCTNTCAYPLTNQTLTLTLNSTLVCCQSFYKEAILTYLLTTQHSVVNIQRNIVACPTYPKKFIVSTSNVIVTMPQKAPPVLY